MIHEIPAWLSSTLASDAAEGQGVLPSTIASLHSAATVVGPARVALMSADDNLSVRKLLDSVPSQGSVLVIAGGSVSRTATVGGLLALEMRNLGVVGLVTDGLVRDTQEIRALGFGVWCRGVTPIASHKHGPAHVGGVVSIGGVSIRDGDLVIADEDGVVIWPQDHVSELLAKAEIKYQQDAERLKKLELQQN